MACNTAQHSSNCHLPYWNTELCIFLTAMVRENQSIYISEDREENWGGRKMVSSAVISLATARAAAWWLLCILTGSIGLLHLFCVFTVSISISVGRSSQHMRTFLETCLPHSKTNVGFCDYGPVKFRKYHDISTVTHCSFMQSKIT